MEWYHSAPCFVYLLYKKPFLARRKRKMIIFAQKLKLYLKILFGMKRCTYVPYCFVFIYIFLAPSKKINWKIKKCSWIQMSTCILLHFLFFVRCRKENTREIIGYAEYLVCRVSFFLAVLSLIYSTKGMFVECAIK